MAQQLLIITGVTGHVGFRVLAEALARRYRVRAVVRKIAQAERIKNTASIKPYEAQLEFAEVPDLASPGAFQGVLDGADGVVHVASPVPTSKTQSTKSDMIDPAVNVTLELLKAAIKVPTINRVVITSSITALISWEYFVSSDVTRLFSASDNYIPTNLDGPFAGRLDAYGTSKAAALAATERFVREEKPSWDVVNIMPSVVIGRNELDSKPEDIAMSTNIVVSSIILNTRGEEPVLGASVHINDIARMHIDALNPSVPGNRNYIGSSGGIAGTVWDDAKDIARRHFSEEVKNGVLPLEGTQPSRTLHFETSETERIFGWKFASYEEQVQNFIGHYLELITAQKA